MLEQNQRMQPEEIDAQENELLRILRILWNRKYMIIVIVSLFLVVTTVQLKRATPVFIATSQIEFEPNSLRIFESGEIGAPTNSQLELQTQLELIRSPEVTKAVIDALGNTKTEKVETPTNKDQEDEFTVWTPIEASMSLYKNIRWKMRQWIVPTKPINLPQSVIDEENTINTMANRVSVRQEPNKYLINIKVRHTDPHTAAAIANEYAIQYRDWLKAKRDSAYQIAKDFYTSQLETAKDELEAAENSLFEYSQQQNLNLITEESEMVRSQINDLNREIFELEKKVNLSKQALQLEDQEEANAYLLSQSNSYNALKGRLEELYIQKVQLSAENLPSHYDAQKLDREIAALEERLNQETADVSKIQRGELARLQSDLDVLKEIESERSVYLDELNTKMAKFNVLQRDLTAKTTLYDILLRELNETNVASNINTSRVTVVKPAIVPRASTEPRVGRTLVTNSFMGFVLGCLIALGLSYIDRSIRDPKEIERATKLPTLGTIPYMGSIFGGKGTKQATGKKATIRLLDSFDNYSREVESFRLLRTSLQYSRASSPPKVILITSANPSEGKSTTGTNLALSYASLDKKTLIIDADLKLPSLHSIFATNRQPGLTDILVGTETLESVLQKTTYENLDLITAGHSTVNPAELLESKKMNDFLEQIKSQYDQVIIDTTPISGLADPLALASKTDGVALVCSVGKTNIDDFKRVVERMRQLQIQMLGVVYNHKHRGSRSSERYGKYGTKYGSYGQYGYYRKKDEESEPSAKA